MDADNLSRSLFFTTQLLELGIPMVVALNKIDLAQKHGAQIDAEILSRQLGCPVIPTVSTSAKGLKAVMEAVLTAAGTSFDKVVKTTCFLADIADFAAFNAVYGKYITSAPARSCVAVKDLPKGSLVEVEVIALID